MTIEHQNYLVDDQLLRNRKDGAESAVYRLLWPVKIADPLRQMKEAENLLQNGCSILGIFSHKRMSDGPILALSMLRNFEVRFHRLLFPIAYHQFESPLKPALEYYSRKFSIELFPLVIRDTLKKPRYNHLQRGAGLINYAKSAVRALSKNSAVFLSPQEGRRPTLGHPEVTALGLIVNLAQKAKLTNVGILPLDITGYGHDEIPDAGSGFTLFRPSILTVGRMTLLPDAIREATEQFGDQKGEGVYPIDHWGFSQLRQIVPVWYRR